MKDNDPSRIEARLREWCDEAPDDVMSGDIRALLGALEEARREREHTEQQARIWKQEARTMQSIVAECYQAATGSSGEPGDWNGARPVVNRIAELEARLRKHENTDRDERGTD